MSGPIVANVLFSNSAGFFTELFHNNRDSSLVMQRNPVVNAELMNKLVEKFMNLPACAGGCFYMIIEVHSNRTDS